MKSPTVSLAIIAVLCVSAAPLSRSADQPFIGKWKLNLSKSKLADQMTIAPAGANRYTLTFAGVGDTKTLLADGTDQPGVLGSTISVTVEAPGNWKIVRKQGGRTILTANWKLSDDGKALTERSLATSRMVRHRALTWFTNARMAAQATPASRALGKPRKKSPIQRMKWKFVLTKATAFLSSFPAAAREQREVRWKGISARGRQSRCRQRHIPRRLGDHSIELTKKLKGKIVETREINVSPDLKTLTMTRHLVDQRVPNILIFDRA